MKTADVLAYYAKHQPTARPLYAIAAAIGVTRQAIEQWGKIVPEGSAYKLESITAGELKANPQDYRKARAA